MLNHTYHSNQEGNFSQHRHFKLFLALFLQFQPSSKLGLSLSLSVKTTNALELLLMVGKTLLKELDSKKFFFHTKIAFLKKIVHQNYFFNLYMHLYIYRNITFFKNLKCILTALISIY